MFLTISELAERKNVTWSAVKARLKRFSDANLLRETFFDGKVWRVSLEEFDRLSRQFWKKKLRRHPVCRDRKSPAKDNGLKPALPEIIARMYGLLP